MVANSPLQYQSGQTVTTALTGNELVSIDAGGATVLSTYTRSIADLNGAGVSTDITNTAITTVGNGTLTAAGLIGGLITRTGPVAAYTDTTATAAQIVTAIGSFVSGATFQVEIKNGTAFLQTIAAGTGVTLPTTVITGPFQSMVYYGVIGGTSASPTVTFGHLGTGALADPITVNGTANTALNTVGAGTVTAAGINGGFTIRGGSQSNTAFTDTTDTAANIISGNPGLVGKIGTSFLYYYRNTTNANATLSGGTGVTVSGVTVVPGGTWALYLVTYTAAATITMVGVASANPTTASGTLTLNGATPVTVTDSRVTANSSIVVTLKTVGGTVGVYPHIATITAGTGFTIVGTALDTSVYNYLIIG